ncbi:MAG: ammonium transporter [Ignavibacteriales bacterium]|nr:ammonium transporter [Ignavibacteriales bacterium]
MMIGYSLSFGPDIGHVIGSWDWFGLRGVDLTPNPDYAPTIPHQLFMLYQMMFAVITPALITGAFAERFKFKTFLLFILLWSTLVYDPIAHWAWGVNGWIRNMGALDFAGGLVVHVSSGVSALVAAILVGKRRGHPVELMPPHNMTMTLLGAALLWFGWFGFNAGSALGSSALAVSAFAATHIAAAVGALSWTFAEWFHRGKPTVLGAASGAVAGLVAITPASGFVGPTSALVIGAAAGMLCYVAVGMKMKWGYDDSLDAVGIHGVGGSFGALVTGVFASMMINSAGADGVIFGSWSLLGAQAIALGASMTYSFAVTWILLKGLDKFVGLRVTPQEEMEGLDLSQHGEAGYTF